MCMRAFQFGAAVVGRIDFVPHDHKGFMPHAVHLGRAKGGTRKMYQWKKECPQALCAIHAFGLQCATVGETAYSKDRMFRLFKAEDCLAFLWWAFPDLSSQYELATGNQLTSEIIKDRHHKMYYMNNKTGSVGPGRGGLSPTEHPTNCRALWGHIGWASQLLAEYAGLKGRAVHAR